MGFEEFGKISYVAQTKIGKFVDYLKQGKIMAVKCRKCGRKYFPPRPECPECLTEEMEWIELKGKGELITFTELHFAPEGFTEDLPYFLAVAELEDNVKVFARLSKQIKPEEVKIGMPVQLKIVNLPNGKITYEFQKV